MPESSAALDISAFKHVVVPIGVVVGLGVARMMTSIATYVQNRERVSFGLGHGLFTILLFLWFVGLWWIAWGFRTVDADLWSFFTLIFLLTGPCLLFLAGALLMPELPDSGDLDLAERFERLGTPFFLCQIAFFVWLAGTEILLRDEPWLVWPKRGLQSTAIAILAIGAARPSRRNTAILGAIMLPLVIFALATVRAKLE